MISVADPDVEVAGEVLSFVAGAWKYLGARKSRRTKGRHAWLPYAPRLLNKIPALV